MGFNVCCCGNRSVDAIPRYPPVTDEQMKSLMDWFAPRKPNIAIERIPSILKDIEERYGEKNWGAVGVCFFFYHHHHHLELPFRKSRT